MARLIAMIFIIGIVAATFSYMVRALPITDVLPEIEDNAGDSSLTDRPKQYYLLCKINEAFTNEVTGQHALNQTCVLLENPKEDK